jgi:hypothetical protein
VTKTPDRNNLRNGRFILAYDIRAFSPWLLDPKQLVRTSWWQEYVAEEVLHGRQEAKREGAIIRASQI